MLGNEGAFSPLVECDAEPVYATNESVFCHQGVSRNYSLAGSDLFEPGPRYLQLQARPMASRDGTYFTGGRSTLDGVRSNNYHRNWRAGGTLALPIDTHNSISYMPAEECPHAPATILI
jgi:hypothetical protein